MYLDFNCQNFPERNASFLHFDMYTVYFILTDQGKEMSDLKLILNIGIY